MVEVDVLRGATLDPALGIEPNVDATDDARLRSSLRDESLPLADALAQEGMRVPPDDHRQIRVGPREFAVGLDPDVCHRNHEVHRVAELRPNTRKRLGGLGPEKLLRRLVSDRRGRRRQQADPGDT